jgi:hypothetical protein
MKVELKSLLEHVKTLQKIKFFSGHEAKCNPGDIDEKERYMLCLRKKQHTHEARGALQKRTKEMPKIRNSLTTYKKFTEFIYYVTVIPNDSAISSI